MFHTIQVTAPYTRNKCSNTQSAGRGNRVSTLKDCLLHNNSLLAIVIQETSDPLESCLVPYNLILARILNMSHAAITILVGLLLLPLTIAKLISQSYTATVRSNVR